MVNLELKGPEPRTATTTRPRTLAALTTLAALGVWGLVHIAGGLSLLFVETADGLETLGPNVTDSVPAEPGEAATALLRFHSLNIVLGGFAVLGLAIAWWTKRRRWQLDVSISCAAAFDIGLVAFLVIPGMLPAGQGLIGPALVAVSLVGGYRARQATPPSALTA